MTASRASTSSAFDVGGVSYFENLLRDARGEVSLISHLRMPSRDFLTGLQLMGRCYYHQCAAGDSATICARRLAALLPPDSAPLYLQVLERSDRLFPVGCLLRPCRREARPLVRTAAWSRCSVLSFTRDLQFPPKIDGRL